MHYVLDFNLLYNNCFTCYMWGWHCTHVWIAFAWPHHFTKRRCVFA